MYQFFASAGKKNVMSEKDCFVVGDSRYSVLERAHTNRPLPKRDLCSDVMRPMRVKLVRKFANVLNGIDLTHVRVGAVIDVAPHHAAMLIAEGWAEPATPQSNRDQTTVTMSD